ncbi:MAG: hypothetical protein WD278_19260 [Pirellulales bacterium]
MPTLRDMARLEQAQIASEAAPVRVKAEWGIRQGLIFLGLATILVCVPPSLFLWYSYPQPPRVVEDFDQKNREDLDSYTIEQVWEAWHQLQAGLTIAEEEPGMLQYLHVESVFRNWAYLAAVVAGAGVLLTVAGLAWPRQRKKGGPLPG